MGSKEKLIVLLDKYMDEYKNMKKEYQTKRTNQTLYEELINVLTTSSLEEEKFTILILLDTIYKDSIYLDEFSRLLLQKDENAINNFINKIKKEYNNLKFENKTLKIRINKNYELFSSARRVKANIKYQTPISKEKNDFKNMERIISYFQISGLISNKEELLLLNEIELHNRNVATKRKNISEEREYADSLYNEIPNILNTGFQKHDEIEVSENRKNSLDKFAIEIKTLLECCELNGINELLESYEVYKLEQSEYNYIILKVLDECLEELITLYELLIDREVYKDKSSRIDVIKDYYKKLDKYLIVRKYYENVSKYIPEETENKELIEESKTQKTLIYSHSKVNATKTKIISDMSDIPYEYYETVYELITGFKNGTLQPGEFKALRNNKQLKGCLELRYDQVRIIIKHVKDNIYNVSGAFVKKDDVDLPMYTAMANRMIADISNDRLLSYQIELANKTEEELKKIVQEKGRKGTR